MELIYEKARSPELEYMFKHALTDEVAYESLLRQKRRELHRRTAQLIEELYTDRLAEFSGALAWHYVQGEVWPKAIEYLLKAADKARSQYAYPVATRFCVEAIEILDRHVGAAQDKVPALELLADLQSLQGRPEPANEAYESALMLADEPGTLRRIANKRHRYGHVVRGGAKIAYCEHGSGEPTLLLLSPLVYGLATFQAPLELLCQDFRIITIDPRGQGRSDPLPGPYSLCDHAEDVRAVVEASATRAVVFIGISKSGSLGVHFATAYPHLVDKLITVGAAPVLPWALDFPGPVDNEFWARRLEMALAGDYQKLLEAHVPQILSEPGCQNLVEMRIQLGRGTPRKVFHNQFYPEPADDIRHLLPDIRVPTLVLHGEADRLFPLEAGRYMAENIPGAQFYVFKGRCHLPVATATAEFAQVVRRFVRTGRPT